MCFVLLLVASMISLFSMLQPNDIELK